MFTWSSWKITWIMNDLNFYETFCIVLCIHKYVYTVPQDNMQGFWKSHTTVTGSQGHSGSYRSHFSKSCSCWSYWVNEEAHIEGSLTVVGGDGQYTRLGGSHTWSRRVCQREACGRNFNSVRKNVPETLAQKGEIGLPQVMCYPSPCKSWSCFSCLFLGYCRILQHFR